jgi:hypothetical protein
MRTWKAAPYVSLLAGLALGCGADADMPESSGIFDSAEVVGEQSVPLNKLDHTPIAQKELFVTDVSVVNATSFTNYVKGKWNTDKEGGFSFGRLVDNLARVEKPTDQQRSDLVMNWLRLWETPQTINGQIIAARPRIREVLITPWKLASVGKLGNTSSRCDATPATDFTCKLSFGPNDVPFRLLAIVNRPDLRLVPERNDATTGSAGQGRFVFGVLDAAKQPLPFVIIFEYMVPVRSNSDIQGYAEKWHKLGKIPFGSKFNEALHALTLEFTKWNRAPWRNNGSALLQIRTNEVAIAEPGSDPTNPINGSMWEMREFIVGQNGNIVVDTVKQEPPIALSGTPILSDWVNANASAILAGKHEVPADHMGTPFLAASSFTPFEFTWQVNGASEELRHAFAINTCNGCHRKETNTGFLHVRNRQAGVAATLSTALTDELAPGGPRIEDFSDLLTTDFSKIKDGPGRDGDDDDDDDD